MKRMTGFFGVVGSVSTRGALALALTATAAGLWACSGEFKTSCPEGTTQTAGGGDVDAACTPNDQLAGQGGGGGQAGATPSAGSGGVSGAGGNAGAPPIPPGGECAPTQTRCAEGRQQACGSDARWGAPTECDLGCDVPGVGCVVPTQLAADAEGAGLSEQRRGTPNSRRLGS